MKNKTLRILSLGLAANSAISTSTPVFAYDVDEHDNSIESAQYQNAEDENFNNVTNVFAQIGSEYKVTIPKVVVLSGVSKTAFYYVKVEGDIAGYEKVNVIPDDNFKLFAKNKDSQTATVNQDKTVWTVHDFDTNANGLIEASSITAGKWQGKFNFNINLESNLDNLIAETKVINNNGKELVLSSIILPEDEKENAINMLLDTSIIKNENDIDKILKIDKLPEDMDTITISIKQPDDTKIVLISEKDKEIKYLGSGIVKENKATIQISDEKILDVAKEDENGKMETIYKAGFYDSNMNLIASWDDLISYGWDPSIDCNAANFADEGKNSKMLYKIAASHPEILEADTIIFKEGLEKTGETIFREQNNKILFSNVKTLVFPNSINSTIGTIIGRYLPNLENIRIRNDNEHFVSINGVVYSKDLKTLMFCPAAKTNLVVPDSVEKFGFASFSNNKAKTAGPNGSGADIILPNNLKTLEKQTFCNSFIEHVVFPENIETIGAETFTNCTNLKTIFIPKSLKTWDVGKNSLGTNYLNIFSNTPDNFTIYCEIENENMTNWAPTWKATSATKIGITNFKTKTVIWNMSRNTYMTNYFNK